VRKPIRAMYIFDLTKKEVIITSRLKAIEESQNSIMDLFFTAQIDKKEVNFYNIKRKVGKNELN